MGTQGDLFGAPDGTRRRSVANVFTIPAGTSFVDSLAAGLIVRYGAAPGLSRVRILTAAAG